MKRAVFVVLALFFVGMSVQAQAQVAWIPGMPVPQSDAPTPVASAESHSGQGSGSVSRVSVAGQPSSEPSIEAVPDDVAQGVEPEARAEYKGVTPPTRLEPENKALFERTSGNQLSWIGFMPEETGHRIFIQTSQATSFELLASRDDRVEILISKTKLSVSNNHRELDMSYFQTPFLKAQAIAQGRDVKVIVQLKEAMSCRVEQHENIIEIIAQPKSE